jgi:predicted nucleic acid-binding protein
VILVDTSGLLSALDESQRYHHQCATVLQEASPPLLLSPFVLAELDYLLMRHLGHHAQGALLDEVARGAYQLEAFDAADVARAKEIIQRYAELQIGLADASIVVLAERYGVAEVLTLDERHFRAMRLDRRKRFKVLPLDSQPG